MSFKLVAQVFDIRVGNPLRKMVLIKLADQANDDGYCWPSYETLAWSCEISRSSVINHIKWLEEQKFLWVEKRYNAEEQKNLSNIYHLTLSKGVQVKEKSSVNATPPLVQEIHHPSAGDTPPLVQEIHHPSVGATPKPIIEPIKKPIIEPLKKKKVLISDCFEPNDEQKRRILDYGIDGDMLVESFISFNKANGSKFLCWHEMFTVAINNHITQNRLSLTTSKPFVKTKPSSFQSQSNDVYHPSQSSFEDLPANNSVIAVDDPNWRWQDPFPDMSIIETDRYIKAHKRKGENPNKAYQRLLIEIQEQGL